MKNRNVLQLALYFTMSRKYGLASLREIMNRLKDMPSKYFSCYRDELKP